MALRSPTRRRARGKARLGAPHSLVGSPPARCDFEANSIAHGQDIEKVGGACAKAIADGDKRELVLSHCLSVERLLLLGFRVSSHGVVQLAPGDKRGEFGVVEELPPCARDRVGSEERRDLVHAWAQGGGARQHRSFEVRPDGARGKAERRQGRRGPDRAS